MGGDRKTQVAAWILMPQTEEGNCNGGKEFGIGHKDFEESYEYMWF